MLTSLELINFKNHQRTHFKGFARLAALVGPNGVGKSTVLQAAQLVLDLGKGGNAAAICYPSKSDPLLVERIRHQQAGFRINATGRDAAQGWRVELSFPRAQSHWSRHVYYSANDGEFETIEFDDDAAVARSDIRNALCGAIQLRLESSKLRKPSYPEELPPELRIDGQGLASAVGYLMGIAPQAFHDVVEQLRSVFPNIQGIRVNRIPIKRQRMQTVTVDGQPRAFQVDEEVYGDQLLFDSADASGIPGHLQSDGVLTLLAILCALSMPGIPKTILIDDVETGLHPRAQRSLMTLLRDRLEHDAELQILLVTHSRYIVDCCKAEEVWVMAPSENGPKVAQLDEHPNAFEALPMLTTGEFWGSEGEAWLLKM